MGVLRSFVTTFNSHWPIVSDCWSGKKLTKQLNGEEVLTSYDGKNKYDDEKSKDIVDEVAISSSHISCVTPLYIITLMHIASVSLRCT